MYIQSIQHRPRTCRDGTHSHRHGLQTFIIVNTKLRGFNETFIGFNAKFIVF